VGRTAARLKAQAPAPKVQDAGRPRDAGRESTLALDQRIHERLRLGILSALAVNDRLTFSDLKRLLKTTDGNLSVHARKLEDAGYVACEKTFEGRVPRSEYRLTTTGRRALEKYLAHMEALINAVKEKR
jgi:DNA-binding MarR family transcriptional regulator